jgi:hypothetical protein
VADNPRYLIELEVEPGPGPPMVRIRRALKWLLRRFGLRCRDIRAISPASAGPPSGAPAGPPLTPAAGVPLSPDEEG